MKNSSILKGVRERKSGDKIIALAFIALIALFFWMGHFGDIEAAGFRGMLNWALGGGAVFTAFGLFSYSRQEIVQSIVKARRDPVFYGFTFVLTVLSLFSIGAIFAATLWFVLRYSRWY